MLDGIEALMAIEQLGTVSEAAVKLRLTQSAVSKRIQQLQASVGFLLLEPVGRRVQLTPHGIRFLEQAKPLFTELRNLTHLKTEMTFKHFSMAFSDSIGSSWGPEVMKKVLRGMPSLQIDFHSHRSVLVAESVALGKYQIGLCTRPATFSGMSSHLTEFPIFSEPMVFAHSFFRSKATKKTPLFSIEDASATWNATQSILAEEYPHLVRKRPVPVESFPTILQMVKAGLGNGIVPLGLVKAMRIPTNAYRPLHRVKREIVLITRKSLGLTQPFDELKNNLIQQVSQWFQKS